MRPRVLDNFVPEPTPQSFAPVGPEQIFRVTPMRGFSDVRPGSLISFQYNYYQHDPHPLVMVTDMIYVNGHHLLRGVNVHYLPTSQTILTVHRWADSPAFSWEQAIKMNLMLVRAFRSYRGDGVIQPVIVDWRGFMTRLQIVRNLDPMTRQALVMEVERQLIIRRLDPGQVQAAVNNFTSRIGTPMAGPAPSVGTQITAGPIAPPASTSGSTSGSNEGGNA